MFLWVVHTAHPHHVSTNFPQQLQCHCLQTTCDLQDVHEPSVEICKGRTLMLHGTHVQDITCGTVQWLDVFSLFRWLTATIHQAACGQLPELGISNWM
jgi:hypothetical protein